MSAAELVVWTLLALGVGAQLAAVAGVLAASDVWDRLHFTGLASIFGPAALALAIVLDEGPLTQAGLKAILVAMLILALDPILVHATARAALVRERGALELLPEERAKARP